VYTTDNFLFQVVLSLAVAAQAAPQLLYGGVGIHAIPTVVKQEVKYKTAAFEPVEADTPADATLIELKETEHKFDTLVPGPVQYAHTGFPLGYGYGYGLPLAAAPVKVEVPEVKTIELPATPYLGYPYGLGLGYPYGLPVVAAAPAAEEPAAE
jgi:hypothetical protein